jgi:hypothetical protein
VTTLDNDQQQLLARIDQLQQRIEVLYGELYAKRRELLSPSLTRRSLRPRREHTHNVGNRDQAHPL